MWLKISMYINICLLILDFWQIIIGLACCSFFSLIYLSLLISYSLFLFFSVSVASSMKSSWELNGVANVSTFLLDRESGILYLGARDAIVAVDTANKLKSRKVNFILHKHI